MVNIHTLIFRMRYICIIYEVYLYNLFTKGIEIPEGIDEEIGYLLRGLLTREPDLRWQESEIRRWLNGKRNIKVYYQYGNIKSQNDVWEEKGFTEKEKKMWEVVTDDPDVAYSHKMNGFAAEESREWIGIGIMNGEVARQWKEGNYSPEDAAFFEGRGIGAYKIRDLQKKFKIETDELKVYLVNHGRLDQIEKIVSMGLNIKEYVVWRDVIPSAEEMVE